MGDERDRFKATDEPDVEAHRHKLHSEEADAEKSDDDDDDTPDVEAHRHKL